MKSIFWVQSPISEDPGIMVLDGEKTYYGDSEKTWEAMDFLRNGEHTRYISVFSWKNLIKKFGLSPSFRFCITSQGTFIQSSTLTKDEYGRPLPFMAWNESTSVKAALASLKQDSIQAEVEINPNLFIAVSKAYRGIMIKGASILAAVIALLTIIGFCIW